MSKFSLFLFLFFLFGLSMNSFAVDTLANCKLNIDESEETLSSYSVLRDGDRMYGRYRLTEGRDYEETDDIFLKKYERENLSRLRESGVLQKLAEALKVESNKIEKVVFFGMVEVEEEDDEDEDNSRSSSEDTPPAPVPAPPVYLMELYKVSGSLGVTLGTVGKPMENDFLKCNNSRFIWF